MMTVKTYVAESKIPTAGLGVFANQDIQKGQQIWVFSEGIDEIIAAGTYCNHLDRLSDEEREETEHFSYFDKEYDGWVICGDSGKYMNHSDNPNVLTLPDGTCVAACDIAAGTELTTNYADLGLPTNFAA